MGQKSQTQNVTKLKNLNVTKLKNSKFYKTLQLKYNKTKKNVTKLRKNQFVTNLIRLNCEREKTHKPKIVRKILISSC